MQTPGRRPQTNTPDLWRRELLALLGESTHLESEWAETVLVNELGFTPSADAWMKESSEAEAEASGDAILTDELECVSQRMACSLQEGPGGAEQESPPTSPEI